MVQQLALNLCAKQVRTAKLTCLHINKYCVFNANRWAHWLALSEAQVARNARTVRTALMLPEGKHPRKQGAKDRPRLPE